MSRRIILLIVLLIAVCSGSHGQVLAQEAEAVARARPYVPLFVEAGRRSGVDPRLLWTIAYLETRFRPGLISPKGARGLMQLMPATAVRYGLLDPLNPRHSIDAAARYVHDLSSRFGGHIELILAAYNAGEGTVEAFRSGRSLILADGKIINAHKFKTDGVPPYVETVTYVARGTAILRHLRRDHRPLSGSILVEEPEIRRIEKSIYACCATHAPAVLTPLASTRPRQTHSIYIQSQSLHNAKQCNTSYPQRRH